MPTLYIDGSAISLNNKGVGRYALEVCRRVVNMLPKDWEVDLFVYSSEIPEVIRKNPRVSLVQIPKMSDIVHNVFWLPWKIRKKKYSVLFKPQESCGLKYSVPLITVCHDVQELIDIAANIRPLPHRSLVNYVKRKLKSLNLRNSAVVVCNSAYTKVTAASWYGFDEAKARIGYCGVDEKFFELSAEIRKSRKRVNSNFESYILTFATGDARENAEFLPEVLLKSLAYGCKSKFIIAGVRKGDDYVFQMDQMLRDKNLKKDIDYKFVEFIGEERLSDLIELYVNADYYLELSGHEGFGMQLAEAMACGTTCISSGVTALAEVGAGFDVRFDSFDPDRIALVIAESYHRKLHMRDNSDQIDYVRQHYSWDSVAELVLNEILSLENNLLNINV